MIEGRLGDTSEELQLRTSLQRGATSDLAYVQGMNVLAAPFLTVLPEMEAFYAFSKLLWHWCPLYVRSTLKGVHCGLKVSCVYRDIITFLVFNHPFLACGYVLAHIGP